MAAVVGQSVVDIPFFVIPISKIDYAKFEVAQASVLQATITDATRKWDMAFGGWEPLGNQIGVDGLRPRDVGRPTASDNRWIWTSPTTAGTTTFQNWINTTTNVDLYVMISGYFNLEAVPNTHELLFNLGAASLPIINIEYLKALQDAGFYFPWPKSVSNSSRLQIQASYQTVSVAERMGLMGLSVAKSAYLITQ